MTSAAILGAGPIGLEAALAAHEHGLDVRVYERAATVGGHVRRWGHITLFTPWDMNVSPRMRRALGDRAPAGDELPTGEELTDALLEPAAETDALRGRIHTGTTVLRVGRDGLLKHEEISSHVRSQRPFRLLVESADGTQRIERANIVVDATGTYANPNRLGDGGIDAVNERAFEPRITRFLEPLHGLAGATVLLTGSGHSAQTAARELAQLAREAPGTRVIWSVRHAQPDFGAVTDDPLPARVALNRAASELAGGASPAVDLLLGHTVEELHDAPGGRVRVTLRNGSARTIDVDHIVALNGAQPDASIYRQLQVHECYASLGPMNLSAALLGAAGTDCLAQTSHGPETLRTPEPGFFVLGTKSYGRNSQFLLRTGWQQVDDVFSELI